MKSFYVQLRQRLAQHLVQVRRLQQLNRPGLLVEPNPCWPRDVPTMHLCGLRCCPVEVELRSASGELLSERRIMPLSDHHRLPLTLPRDAPPGMYRVVARPSGLVVLDTWVAVLDDKYL